MPPTLPRWSPSTRTYPGRYTHQEMQGFFAFPAALIAGWFFLPTHLVPIWALWAACLGYVLIYWSLLNYMQSNAAAVLLLTCGMAAAIIVVWVIVGWAGFRLPGYDTIIARPMMTISSPQ